jgi:urate oxidase
MTIQLAESLYGETRVRLMRVTRRDGHHELKNLTLSVRFEGDFESAHTAGDNRKILPADTMKNTVYILAQQYPSEAVEEFALHLIEHFLTYNPQVAAVEINATERPWSRISLGDKPHALAFVSSSSEKRTTRIRATREKTILESGIKDLTMLKTAQTGFTGFQRDPYTTLEESRDQILSLRVRANWRYREADVPFSTIWHGARKALLETFAMHESRSPQHMLYAMGQAALDNFDALDEIRLSITDEPYLLADLSQFGMENKGEVFIPLAAPQGSFEATLRRE